MNNDLFGRYALIEMYRYDTPNEMYVHKVVGGTQSNTWVETPIILGEKEKIHSGKMEDVVKVVQAGVDETYVFRVRLSDIELVEGISPTKETE